MMLVHKIRGRQHPMGFVPQMAWCTATLDWGGREYAFHWRLVTCDRCLNARFGPYPKTTDKHAGRIGLPSPEQQL